MHGNPSHEASSLSSSWKTYGVIMWGQLASERTTREESRSTMFRRHSSVRKKEEERMEAI
jgi:hypothetical protein